MNLGDLISKKKSIRYDAYKSLLENSIEDKNLCAILNESLKISYDYDSWKRVISILRIVGKCRCSNCIETLKEIIMSEDEYSMILIEATKTLIRVNRHSEDQIKKLLKLKIHSVTTGVFDVLGYDKVLLSEKLQITLLKEFRKSNYKRGFGDNRYGLALACKNWDEKIVEDFLQECANSVDVPLQFIANKILNKEKFKPNKEYSS